jgi:hypothetical protein
MKFDKLHEGLERGCNCVELKGVSENTNDFFTRAITGKDLTMNDLKSYHEIGKIPRGPQNCKARCRWRGVSINKLSGNKTAIKEKWLSIPAFFSPQGVQNAFVCTFKLKTGAGKVWDTSSNRPEAHHDLLKADGFNLESVEIREIVPFADF